MKKFLLASFMSLIAILTISTTANAQIIDYKLTSNHSNFTIYFPAKTGDIIVEVEPINFNLLLDWGARVTGPHADKFTIVMGAQGATSQQIVLNYHGTLSELNEGEGHFLEVSASWMGILFPLKMTIPIVARVLN